METLILEVEAELHRLTIKFVVTKSEHSSDSNEYFPITVRYTINRIITWYNVKG